MNLEKNYSFLCYIHSPLVSQNNLELSKITHFNNILLDYEPYRDFLRIIVEKPTVPIRSFLRQINDIKIEEYIEDITGKYPEVNLMDQITYFIDYKFCSKFYISNSFIGLLSSHFEYRLYFQLLKRFTLYFLHLNEIDFHKFYGHCTYEEEIDYTQDKIPKIRFYIPTNNFNLVLDYFEKFMNSHALFLKNRFEKKSDYQKFSKQFKRTNFLFRKKY